jgi:hypothetical protein
MERIHRLPFIDAFVACRTGKGVHAEHEQPWQRALEEFISERNR